MVFLPAKADLSIKSISGNIEAKNMDSSLSLETISGFVDVSLNPNSKYNIECSTITGSIYSDMNFDLKGQVKADIVGSKLNTVINSGGGKTIELKTISGDLFIRERK